MMYMTDNDSFELFCTQLVSLDKSRYDSVQVVHNEQHETLFIDHAAGNPQLHHADCRVCVLL